MRTLNDVHAIPATSNHEYAVTRLYSGPITCSSDTSWHATGNKAREIKRDVLIDYDDRGLIHYSALCKSTDHAKGPDGNTLPVTPAISAVELRSLGDARAFSAKMMQTLTTPPANSAGRDESEHHVITAPNFANLGTNCLDDTGGLVAEYHRPHGYAPLSAHHVIVGAAQTDG